ncbi:DNA gyrase subunit A [Acidocella aminolytica 101 = DSM 11237]|uniref:DNA gyrase subunit A n=1 Tax=Acidocella aminolytica TaxID=33998 RepID=UPI002156E4D2|nr:DNA gyrase subunit A [Acidocella aminolytica]GBQ39466.1 DNA gyrase subunit A [Acidocella aminolytica 101 = DSM 11237]
MTDITDEPGAGPLVPRGQEPVSIEQEMRKSYLDYAMSVIVSRALPDARDGLKPVHRRILYAMNEAGNTPEKPYRKSARMTGDVMGTYHPHGDSAIYLSAVRMAQEFSMRLPLIDGQGNFGSIDGDMPAAMRYTEMRLAPAAMLLLQDIDKDTVDFQPNYDESEQEPRVLPAAFPNLLINGSNGIAVGMATNIPPHNPTEIMDAVLAMIANPEISLEELMKIVPGPDFPTSGIILGRSGIRNAFETGKGSIIMRARATIEEIRKDRDAIIVTEIPYQVNKSTLLERIAELVRAKDIEGIADLRDESDREGMRIVIELKRDATGEVVLNQLYRLTQLQQSFGINMLALDRGKPRQMGLKELLGLFIEFREEVVLRRARFDLNKARDRAHLLIGLGIAVANIDEVIRIIRSAPDSNSARAALMERDWPAENILPLLALVDDAGNIVSEDNTIKLTDAQARGILELRLARLTGLEREKIQAELSEVSEKIKEFLEIIGSRIRRLEVMQAEVVAAKAKIESPRKSSIEDVDADLDDESLIEPGQMVITLTRDGFIKRTPLEVFRQQNRGGRGRSAAATRGDDIVTRSFNAHTHQFVLFFSSGGKVYREKVWRLPEAAANTKGRALVNLLPDLGGDQITTVLPLPQDETLWENLHLVFATSSGNVRRNRLAGFKNVRASGLIAMKLDEGDHLIGVATCRDGDDVFLATKLGRCIRFQITDETLRVFSGRDSTGVRGIKLSKDDEVMSLCVLRHVEASMEERSAYLKQRNSGADEDDAAAEDAEEAVDEVTLSEGRVSELADGEEIILTVTDSGFGKRSSAYEYRVTGRGGQGVANITLNPRRNGKAVAASFAVRPGDDVMLVTDGGRLIRVPADQVRLTGRAAMGVTLFRLDDDERVTSVFPVLEDDQEPEANEDG